MKQIVTLVLLIAVLGIVTHRFQVNAETCVVKNGKMPPEGSCEGPIARIVLQRQSTKELGVNGVCNEKTVLYFVDGDQDQPKCGQCTPGTSGFHGAERTCKVDEFCSDDGKCSKIKSHKLYGAACPYDNGIRDSINGFCGPGLRCIQHKCLPCENGEIDMDTGMVCVNNQYTYSAVDKMLYEPTPMILVSIIALYVAYQAVLGTGVFVKFIVKRRRRANRNKQLELQSNQGEDQDPASLFLSQSRKGFVDPYADSSDEEEPDESEDDYDNSEDDDSYEGRIFEDRDENGGVRYYTVRNGRSVWLSEAELAQNRRSLPTRNRTTPKELPKVPFHR